MPVHVARYRCDRCGLYNRSSLPVCPDCGTTDADCDFLYGYHPDEPYEGLAELEEYGDADWG